MTTPWFTMTGEQAEIWASGHLAATLRDWMLTTSQSDRFDLSARHSTMNGLLDLPLALQPAFEVRIKLGEGLLVAPVAPIDERTFRGLAKPTLMKGVAV
mgnify:CR=1 FL=1